jgi:hypothetical protein
MKKEITRLTQLLQNEAPSHEQVPKTNPLPRVGEFEKHTKGFGSKYMSKYGFEKGKRLGKNEDGAPQEQQEGHPRSKWRPSGHDYSYPQGSW